MDLTRGRFFKLCGAALVGAQAGAWPWRLIAGARPTGLPRGSEASQTSAAEFRRYVNTEFRVRASEGTDVPLVLARVEDGPASPTVEQFSLLFRAPAGVDRLHGTYAFRHARLELSDLFIVPIGRPAANGPVYQACFSRFVDVARGSASCRTYS